MAQVQKDTGAKKATTTASSAVKKATKPRGGKGLSHLDRAFAKIAYAERVIAGAFRGIVKWSEVGIEAQIVVVIREGQNATNALRAIQDTFSKFKASGREIVNKRGRGGVKLDLVAGAKVFIKPAHFAGYAECYSNAELLDLIVDKVTSDGKALLKVAKTGKIVGIEGGRKLTGSLPDYTESE